MVIRRIKGDTYPLQIQILDNDGEAFDLTGCTCFLTIKKRLEDADADALIAKSTTNHSSPTTGTTNFDLTADDTNIDGKFFYDVKVKTGADIIYSVVTDFIIFEKHVTIRTS